MRNIIVNRLLIILFLMLSGAVERDSVLAQGYPCKSFQEFRMVLDRITAIPMEAERISQLDAFWSQLKSDNQIPFRMGDSVAFLYRGEAQSVSWAGDFNGWKPSQPGFIGTRLGKSDIWMAFQKFPPDARLDYKIVVDGNWMLDPDNPYQQMGGMGPNSELHMPDWRFPDETVLFADVIRGSLSEPLLITSEKLGYSVSYRVYLPYNYMRSEGLPSIYITDGQDYANDELGAMVTILDNLIFTGEIKPVIAVFLDPREPGNVQNNRRMKEYVCNQQFADFMGDELVPLIDKSYKTHACPDDRMVLGTSVGGINSAWLGAVRINDFHLLAMHSPALNSTVLDRLAGLDWFPFRVYMTAGVFFDTQKQALQMDAILEKNQVERVYREMNEGHSWGAWRASLPDMLRWFFAAD